MSASIWSPYTFIIAAGGDGTLLQEFTSAPSQTLYTLTNFSYVTGANALSVYRNGAKLSITDFTETSNTSFTLNFVPDTGDLIVAKGEA